ncbi:MAG TPA: OmpA family protein [Ferruginibacter sp.]|nr:OmpA family protein [Ferruginibacter sp.]HMP22017.1 OmpA family protein [Ferruginibacter sp.]
MKKIVLMMLVSIPFFAAAQSTTVQGNLPKDAQVDVTIHHARTGQALPSEIVVFRNTASGTEFQGLSNPEGKFSLRLPSGSRYEVFILGFGDSASYNFLEIPSLKENQYFKTAIKYDIKFEAPASFVLDNCTFETGKAELQPEAYTVLDELVEYLKRKDEEIVEVGGHTDNVGKAEANMLLSQNRANTVRAYLLMKGIAPHRVTAKGYGMTQPITDNDTAEGRAMNRRTEVKILEH